MCEALRQARLSDKTLKIKNASRQTRFDIVVCRASRYFGRVNLPDKFAVKFDKALDISAPNEKYKRKNY